MTPIEAMDAEVASLDRDRGRLWMMFDRSWRHAILAAVIQGLIKSEPTKEMMDAAGEAEYGHPRSSAQEWAKQDKFDSAAIGGMEAFHAVLKAVLHAHSPAETVQ